MGWTKVDGKRWRRNDGAEVWLSDLATPGRPGSLDWLASGPRGRDHLKRKMRFDRPERTTGSRRFGTPQAAMAAVDDEFPLQGSLI